ncbi:MAG: hypothetical protein ACOCW6_08865, partial [Spirochaetota bacterium]
MKRLLVVTLILVAGVGMVFAGGQGEGAGGEGEQETIRLVGATHLPADFVFYRMMEVFAERVQEYYDGPLEVELHHSGAGPAHMDHPGRTWVIVWSEL